MKKLFEKNYVLYDRANDHVIQFEKSGKVIMFVDKQEAIEECRGNEEVLSFTNLPKHWQKIILKEIN